MQPQPPPSLLPSIPPSLPPSSHGGRRPRSGYQLPGRRTLRHVLGQGMPPPPPHPCLSVRSFVLLLPHPFPPPCLPAISSSLVAVSLSPPSLLHPLQRRECERMFSGRAATPPDTHPSSLPLSLPSPPSFILQVREMYAPFECGMKSGTARVYDHEIPGGQYSNLMVQCQVN